LGIKKGLSRVVRGRPSVFVGLDQASASSVGAVCGAAAAGKAKPA
jgi:hypothetical protein